MALVWNTIWIRKNRFHLLFRMEFLTNTIWKIAFYLLFLIKILSIFHGIPRTFILIKCKLPYNFKFQFLKNSDRNSLLRFTEKLFIYQICILTIEVSCKVAQIWKYVPRKNVRGYLKLYHWRKNQIFSGFF